jgi:hypothetical protein
MTNTNQTPLPQLWYPQGSGGMWLNYLLWCNRQQTTLPGPFRSFEFPNVKEQYPEYYSLLTFTRHVVTQGEGNNSAIRLGGNCWFNFYLNIVAKKDGNYYGSAESLLKVEDTDISSNLHWRDLIQNPEKFLMDLSSLVNYKVPLDAITQQAIDQYIDSCPWPTLDNAFQSTDLYKEWARAVRDVKNISNDNDIFAFTKDSYCCLNNLGV